MSRQRIRGRVGRRAVALVLAAVAGVNVAGSAAAAAASPAHRVATTLACTEPQYSLHHVGMKISGLGYRYCSVNPDEPVAVTVQRYSTATGVWQAVASGLGEANYQCTGTGRRMYRIAQRPSVGLTADCS